MVANGADISKTTVMKTETKILCLVLVVSFAYLAVPMIRQAIGLDCAQIDKGIWYKKESPAGISYMKGVSPSSPYIDATEASEMATNQLGFTSIEHGFGVSIQRLDRFTMRLLKSEEWHLFKSEKDAIRYARERYIPINRILFSYK